MFPEELVNISGLRSMRWHWCPSKCDFSTNPMFTPLICTKMILRVRTVAATVTDIDSV
jgi:hypothetical protein